MSILDVSNLSSADSATFSAAIDATSVANKGLASQARRSLLIPNRSAVIASGLTGLNIAGGWGSGNATIDTVNVRRAGNPVLRITAPAGTSEVTARIKIPVRVVNGKLEAWIFVPEFSAGSAYLGFRLSSDTSGVQDPPTGSPANNTRIVLTSGFYNQGSWQAQTIGQAPSGRVYALGSSGGVTWAVNGTPDYTTVAYAEVFFSCTADVPTAQRYMLVDQIAINGKAKPMVMLGFDGYNLTSHQTVVKPLLDQYGLKGYLAGDGDAIASVKSFMHSLYDEGWDIVSSGMFHTNYATNPDLLSPQYDQCRALLDAEGFTRASRFFAYPNTARTDATDATLASKGVVMSRTPYGPPNVISTLGMTNLMYINTFDWGLRDTPTLQLWENTTYSCGELYSTLNHNVVSGSTQPTDTEKVTFVAAIARLAAQHDAGLIDIVTPTEFAARLGISLSQP